MIHWKSESVGPRITKQVSLLNNLNFNSYSFEFIPADTSASGTLFYIDNHLLYKRWNGLNIYKNNQLGSTFIEIVNPKKSNIIVGVIYRHVCIDLTAFNCNFLNKLLENISKERKSIFRLWDFNVNLLNYNTLIDNIFSNVIEPDIISGNLTASISDHLPQFAVIPNIFGNISGNKYSIYETGRSKFDWEILFLTMFLLTG